MNNIFPDSTNHSLGSKSPELPEFPEFKVKNKNWKPERGAHADCAKKNNLFQTYVSSKYTLLQNIKLYMFL